MRLASAACVVLAFGLSAAAAHTYPDPRQDQVRRIVEAEARHASFSGTVLVAHDDRIVYHAAFGYAIREFQVPNTLQTKFNIGSITKTFTALGVAQLMEEARIKADDTVARFLPDWPPREKSTITIHHLLTHTSGLYDFANEDVVFETLFKRGVQEMVPYVYGPGLLFQPGQDVTYSSGGYILLGAIIERVSGLTFAQYVQEKILKPARMEDTALLNAEDVAQHKAVGYKQLDRDRYENRTLWHFPASSAGGLYTTAEDLLKYVRCLLNGRLLPAASLDLLLSPKTREDPDRGRAAYGWWLDRIGGRKVIYHTGGTPGFSSSVYIIPDLGYTAIVLSNSFRGTTGITDSINSALAGGDYDIADEDTYDLRKAVDLHFAGKRQDAMQVLDRIVKGGKPSRRAYYYAALGRIAENVDLQDALNYLDRYIAMTQPGATESLANALYQKGQAYEKLSDSRKAAESYERSLALVPGQDRVTQALARLRKE